MVDASRVLLRGKSREFNRWNAMQSERELKEQLCENPDNRDCDECEFMISAPAYGVGTAGKIGEIHYCELGFWKEES